MSRPPAAPRTRALAVVAWWLEDHRARRGESGRHAGCAILAATPFAAAAENVEITAFDLDRGRRRSRRAKNPTSRTDESQGGDADALVRAGERGARFGDGSGDAAPCEKTKEKTGSPRLARQRSWKSHGRFMGDAVVGENSAMTTVKSCSLVRRAAVVEACATAASASASMAPPIGGRGRATRAEEDGGGAEELGGHHGAAGGDLVRTRWRQNWRRSLRSAGGSAVHQRSAKAAMVAAAWNCASAEALCSRM